MKKKITFFLMGGLGNQLFEYAFGRNLSLRYNCELNLNTVLIQNKGHNKLQIDKYHIPETVIINNKGGFKKKVCTFLNKIYEEKLYNKKVLKLIYENFVKVFRLFGIYFIPNKYIRIKHIYTKNPYFIGYYQCDKYIDENNKETIKNELELKEISNCIIDEQNKKTVCIHIRRGDYVGSQHEVCTKEYYLNAVKYIKSKINDPIYYVFSDDINWVKENIPFSKDDKVNYMEKNEATEDLFLMSQCSNFIMSNSSYSYWGQWLSKNGNKVVVAPSKWNKNDTDRYIYQDNWKKIETE